MYLILLLRSLQRDCLFSLQFLSVSFSRHRSGVQHIPRGTHPQSVYLCPGHTGHVWVQEGSVDVNCHCRLCQHCESTPPPPIINWWAKWAHLVILMRNFFGITGTATYRNVVRDSWNAPKNQIVLAVLAKNVFCIHLVYAILYRGKPLRQLAWFSGK